MLKAKNISLYKIMTAGYLSAEAFTALKPKTNLSQLNLNDCLSYTYKISLELQRLFKNATTYHALCGMEQMEASLSDEDNRPYELLETLLLQEDGNVKDFLQKVGSKVFLLDYVFSSRKDLCIRAFITKSNITPVTLFITKYETAFTQMYSDGEILSGTITNEPMSYSEVYKTNKDSVDAFVGESSVSYNETNPKFDSLPIIVTIDDDAVSHKNIAYEQYVIILSRLTDEEFEPFKIFFERRLLDVPVRTRNGINNLGYHEFYVNYLFADDEKLMSIRKLGRKSVHDFNKIRPSLINHVKNSLSKYNTLSESLEKVVTAVSEEARQEKLEQNLTLKDLIGDIKYAILGNALNEMTAKLSVRANNGINNYHGDFIEDFVHKDKDIKCLKNIGKKTETEIYEVISKLKELAKEAMNTGDVLPEELEIIRYQMYYGSCWDEFTHQFFITNGHLPMFHILENWFKNQKRREWKILNACCSIYAGNEKKTLGDVAEEYNISRERSRQLCVKAINMLHTVDSEELASSTVNYSKIISNKDEWKYITDSFSDNNLLETSATRQFMDEENCGLSQEFSFFILSIILEKEWVMVGHKPISLPTRIKQKWTNTYLIRREYASAFSFGDLHMLLENIEDSLTEDVEVDAEQLAIDSLYTAWNDFDTNKVSVVSDILSHIMIQEFGKIPNECFQFTLEGKKVVKASDIIYGILHKNGNPMNIDNVFTKLEEVCPNRYKSALSIKALILNDPRICMVGTANLVGLVEWSHVKVGSIRDIIAQYLSMFDEPQHVADIVAYVQRYRDSSENSIRSTMSSGDQFVQFNGGLYGLKDKTYAAWYDIPEKRRNFALRVNDMESFLRDNMHFPFNNSIDSHEDSLYNWWRRVLTSDNLSDEQKEEIKRLQEQYKEYPTTRRDNEWNELYKTYKLFIQNYGRKPNGVNTHEKILRRWFEKSKSDFSEGNLSSSQEKMYIELCKLL